jgi:zinc/manganese transport system ATP-binding protein
VKAVELDRVNLARDGRFILADATFAIEEGEFVGVFGPNGAGKTTLLHALLGMLPALAGAIRIFGRPVAHGNATAGYLPQKRGAISDLNLRGWDFVASAVNGQRWGLPRLGAAGRAHVRRALDTVEAGGLAEQPVAELSGGELQRLRLAKALLGNPRLLLLDEPLTSLDPRFQQATVGLVKRIQQSLGVTVLFTAHDANPLVGAMDRVLYLGRGSLALGGVEQVITGEVLSRLYGTPIDVVRVGGRIVVVSALGEVEADAHRHDA